MREDLRFVPPVVLLTSFCLLCYEIILTRIFSIIQWQSLSSVVISLALLGFGASGTFLALFRSRIERNYPTYFLAFLFLFPVTLCLGFILYCRTPFNPFEIGINSREWLYLLSYLASTGIPFLFAAAVIGMALSRYPIGSTYFLNLAGSGVGALAVILLSYLLHPYVILVFITAIALASAVLFSLNFQRRFCILLLPFSILFTAAFYGSFDWLHLKQMLQYKALSRTLLLPQARIVAERYSPLGLVQAVEAEGLHYSGDLSLVCPYQVPAQKALFFDGESMSAVTRFDGNLETIRYLNYVPSSLPHHLLSPEERRKALIVGVGGGEGILKALLHGFGSIEGVEINRNVIEIMENELADFSGRIYTNPRVKIFPQEMRGFLSSTARQYNLIELSLMDSYAAAASGIYALNESYLYTVESIQELFGHLEDGGLLAITRWNVTPPRDNIKMLNLCVTALKRLKTQKIHRHIFYIRSMRASTIVVSRSPLTDRQIERGRAFAQTRLFDLVHYPRIRPEEANRQVRMDPPIYEQAAQALLSEKADAYVQSFPFDISAPTDNRPYYHNFFRWKTLPLLLQWGPQRIPFTEWGYFILVIALAVAAIISFLLILLPLFLSELRARREHLTVLLYFALIGLGFFFVEMPFIQKFILFLHHPTYSLSVIISSLLIFSGLGSYFSDRIFGTRSRIFCSTLILVGILALYSPFLSPLLRLLSPQPDWAKILVTMICLGPLGFFMGIPFPQGLSLAKDRGALILPWAWGINGFFSVLAVIAAHILAIPWGFPAVLFLAGVCYLGAGLLSFRLGDRG